MGLYELINALGENLQRVEDKLDKLVEDIDEYIEEQLQAQQFVPGDYEE
jgi:hypothetical protein